MEKTAGCVLKADNVKMQGQFRLDIGQPVSRPAPVSRPVTAAPQACIVEKGEDFAVMEITCGCGTKMQVRCEYGDAK